MHICLNLLLNVFLSFFKGNCYLFSRLEVLAAVKDFIVRMNFLYPGSYGELVFALEITCQLTLFFKIGEKIQIHGRNRILILTSNRIMCPNRCHYIEDESAKNCVIGMEYYMLN